MRSIRNCFTHHLFFTFLCLYAVSLTAGCGDGGTADDLAASLDTAEASRNLWVLSPTLWRSPVIPVCWENPSAADAVPRGWVRSATEQTWEAVARVDFTGWGTCTASSRGIRIRIDDSNPLVWGIGAELDGMPNGMYLNFSFQLWGNACRIPAQNGLPERINENCVRIDAIHEFGHALGYPHEQGRADVPDTCTDRQPGGERLGDYYLTAYDSDSVMNYCSDRVKQRAWNTAPNPVYRLSANDVAGVQAVYGGKPGMLVGAGRCLDVAGSVWTNGTRLVTGDCGNRSEQRWLQNWAPVVGGSFWEGSMMNQLSGKFIDMIANTLANGTALQLNTKAVATAQSWRMGRNADMTIRGHGGRCMALSPQADAVELAACGTGNPTNPVNGALLWKRDTLARIINRNGKCLEIPIAAVNGTPVQMAECQTSSRQAWDFVAPGRIRSRAIGKCLDVNAFDVTGAPIVVADCNGATSQHWMTRGRVSTSSNKCMVGQGYVNAPGTPVESNACTGAEQQLWDYHW